MSGWQHILLVGSGGFAGAALRYLCGVFGQRLETATAFPSSTLLVNMIGCFLIGVANGIAESRGVLTPQLRLLLVVGFLGSFTTFSTFGHDSFLLLKEASWAKLLFNTIGQVVLGIVLVWAGYLATAR